MHDVFQPHQPHNGGILIKVLQIICIKVSIFTLHADVAMHACAAQLHATLVTRMQVAQKPFPLVSESGLMTPASRSALSVLSANTSNDTEL